VYSNSRSREEQADEEGRAVEDEVKGRQSKKMNIRR